MTEYVKLLTDIDAEGVHIPAGTVCEVEKRYPATGFMQPCLDLIAGEILFWATEDEVEEVKQ